MIANMVRADLPRVALLASQLGYPTSIAALSDRFDEIEANVEYLLLVARDGDDVLGWAQANVEALTLLADRRVELAAIVVDEKARGKKIGVALLHAVENWAKEQGATTIRLRSNVAREDAHRFYLREGYQIAKKSYVLTKDL